MHYAIRSSIKPGLECYMLSIPPARLVGLLGHDPRSQFWKTLPMWLQTIYEQKQRVTQKFRIDALNLYIRDRLMTDNLVAAFPPISVCQFEPFPEDKILPVGDASNVVRLDDDDTEPTRILIDGLARVTAMNGTRDDLREINPEAAKLLDAFRFTVALYAPIGHTIDKEVAGQLFTDFNSYAWSVPAAKSLATDQYNPYKQIAMLVAESDVIKRHGGLKIGANLGKKDTNFTTQLVMAQMVKLCVEGRRAYGGKLTKPLPDPLVRTANPQVVASHMIQFLERLEQSMGRVKFADRSLVLRTAHGLYALAVVMNDIGEGRTTTEAAIAGHGGIGLGGVDWTWDNPEFRTHIGRTVTAKDGSTAWRLNTGTGTFDWLVGYCRRIANVVVTEVAQVA